MQAVPRRSDPLIQAHAADKRGDKQEAADILGDLIARDPQNAEALALLAKVQFDQRQEAQIMRLHPFQLFYYPFSWRYLLYKVLIVPIALLAFFAFIYFQYFDAAAERAGHEAVRQAYMHSQTGTLDEIKSSQEQNELQKAQDNYGRVISFRIVADHWTLTPNRYDYELDVQREQGTTHEIVHTYASNPIAPAFEHITVSSNTH